MEGVGWLAFIFQQSYNYSVVPSDLSKALVTAVFTKDNKSDPSNYRPILLSCICCKIMEHIVLSHTAKHLSTNWRSLQISNMASGNDIPVKPYWLAMMTGPNPLTCGDKPMPYYLTSPKHLTLFPTRLLIKLNYYGVGDGMLMWIPAFFSNRSQVVSIYSYFEKGCRGKCTRQSWKALWVVLSSFFFQRNLKELARKAMEMCLRVLKESNKSRFDSYSVRNSVLGISHITFRDCHVHIFSDNLSRNSCIVFTPLPSLSSQEFRRVQF